MVRVENELVVYTDDEDVRPFFATPFDPVFGASPQFLTLPNDAQERWREVLFPIEKELGGQR